MQSKEKLKVMSVFGTRPEAIKMCPLVKELEKCPDIHSVVCLTGQHREMLDQVMQIFGVRADYDLQIMRPIQTLTSITVDILTKIEEILAREKPDIVLVHGDTSTSFVAALAAFYQKIPVGHVEAGLRTYNPYSPFPEEMNRCLTGRLASVHFAPTQKNADNLRTEGITAQVHVTGNTVIDAFHSTIKQDYIFKSPELSRIRFSGKRTILMTAHRRENIGAPLEAICRGARRIIEEFPDVQIVYPVHPNPRVRTIVQKNLGNLDRVYLTEPLDVEDMHNLMAKSFLVMTDSGGLQEEAPALGVPVLVLRTETERPEAVEAGTVEVIGVEEKVVYAKAAALLTDQWLYKKMANAINPYGDGHASERIVDLIKRWSTTEL
jgi:UDP-N-acetylglucosamine 2-epimerase (non-hydrolysing)